MGKQAEVAAVAVAVTAVAMRQLGVVCAGQGLGP
jgi:hypothetical protein